MISIILLGYNSGDKIDRSYYALKKLLDQKNIKFELIIVDDGSSDDTYLRAAKLAQNNSNVKALKLSRNYTSHYAIFAGLTVSKGECVTVIPDDEQQPYELIIEMHELWKVGNKIILPYRLFRKDSLKERFFSAVFYKIMNRISDISFPRNGMDTFFIDHEIVKILNERISPIATTTITEILRLGFNPYYHGYVRPLGLNKGKSRWTFSKKLRLAKEMFFSSSVFLITLINRLGLGTFLLSVLLAIFYFIYSLYSPTALPLGWSTIIILLCMFSGLILLSLGIIATYINLIYQEVKQRPGFIIEEITEK